MDLTALARLRIHNQQITTPALGSAEEIVHYLGAVQAQDYHQAKWALGVRVPGSTDATIAEAIDAGSIIRTHVLRPTWHLVSPQDVRWMLALSQPQVLTQLGTLERQQGLDVTFYTRAFPVIERALEGGRQRTKQELMQDLAQAGIETDNFVAGFILFRAELAALICNGARRGKEITYALLDERVPPGKTLDRPDALAELGKRYFASHGPATLADFQWWSGLKKSDARIGLEAAQPGLICESIHGQDYWLPAGLAEKKETSTGLFLLPAFDEFLVSYTDRSASLGQDNKPDVITKNGIFKPVIVSDGQVKGQWSRQLGKQTVTIKSHLFSLLSPDEERAWQKAAEQFAAFCGLALQA